MLRLITVRQAGFGKMRRGGVGSGKVSSVGAGRGKAGWFWLVGSGLDWA